MHEFKDHPVKQVIREQWCKPLIKHLCEILGYKLNYLGLPGIKAIDILTWIEYLDKVIAFDIGHYAVKYNHTTAKKNIDKLYQILSKLESSGVIENFSLHHGYIEEVVLKGVDKQGFYFKPSDVITIYNLDFCNALTVPLKIPDPETGEVTRYYKSEVFNKLLALQEKISKENTNSKFIFYLTIHSNFWEDEGKKIISDEKYNFYKEYSDSLKSLNESERNIRLLRFFIIDLLSTQFISHYFIPEFLPTLYYNGTSDNKLLCFTVIGTFVKGDGRKAEFYQSIETLINEKFLQPNDEGINYLIQESIREKNCKRNSVEAIQELKSYKELWEK